MSTTARKLRKRSGVKFVHPTKVATPINERVENQPRQIFGKGPYNEPTRFGFSSKAARRRGLTGGSTPNGSAPQIAIADKLHPKIDPKPFRIGRKRFAYADLPEGEAVFSPRKDFEQDRALYPFLLG